jgi:two-component system LytT family sensor kinase
MKSPSFIFLATLVLCCALMLLAGMFLLANFNRLLKRQIRNELLRKNIIVWMCGICLVFSILPTNPELYSAITSKRLLHFFLVQIVAVTIEALFIFNIALLVIKFTTRRVASFRKRMVIILFAVIISTMFISIPINYMANQFSFKNLELSILFNFYTGCITGLVYITMSYVDLERKRKMNEKELELSRLRELKSKAELDALHSKVNPHFLYNALNSIADLSITDGRKARRMTVALADLFRYSINYNHHNFSTVNDEVGMIDVYLQIEKIRFEDQLSYAVQVEENTGHYLIPRFLLQPLVENAVKHGLKATGKLTEIQIEIKKENEGMVMHIADNGPLFPDELMPGYGVKSVFDKLDLLFPGEYAIHFTNNPRKQITIHIHKLMKNEPGV